MGRNGMFNGSKQFSSAEDVAVCRCKRWVPRWQIFFPPGHIFHVVDVSPGPWQTLMSHSILSQKLTESLGQMSSQILAENNIILTPAELCSLWATSSSTFSTGTITSAPQSQWTPPWRVTSCKTHSCFLCQVQSSIKELHWQCHCKINHLCLILSYSNGSSVRVNFPMH